MNDLAPRRGWSSLPAAVTSPSPLVMDGLLCPNGRKVHTAGRLGGNRAMEVSTHLAPQISGLGGLTDGPAS